MTRKTFAFAALALSACGGQTVVGGGPGGEITPVAAAIYCGQGDICTIAGTGIAGDGADGQKATDTRLYLPQDVSVGPDKRIYVVDWNNHRVRAVDADGVMHIVAGIGELGLSADDPSTNRLNHPTNVAFDPNEPGQMLIAAWHNSRIKKVDLASGAIIDVCGTGKRGFGGNGGPAMMATLDLPVALVFDARGDMLIADQANQMVRKVDHTTDVITTIAGVGRCMDNINPNPCMPINDGGPATAASFHFPIGQAASPGGRIALGPDGSLYVADTENFRLRRIDPEGKIETFAGTGTWGYAGDGGPAKDAQLGRLADVAVARDGSVYIADTDNSCVRVVSPSTGLITTFAGQCGQRGFAGDGAAARDAKLDRPAGLEIGPLGDVFIADTHNNRIRVVGR
jgi:sugar lactone lactonase YvrE